jgi:osmoprotectant transport system ATP-binding protein
MAARGVEFAQVSYTPAGGRAVLSAIDLKIEPGTTVALLGRSGSGKTTLLRMVNGLVRPTSGSVRVGEQDVAQAEPVSLRRGIGYVIQEAGLFPQMSVERNVGMTLELAGERDAAAKRQRSMEALQRVGLGQEMLGRFPWQLSGGQRQRVGVARALVNDADVLLMDEPFGALDPLTRVEIQRTVRNLVRAGEGVTTLLVTHDLEEALFLAHRVVLLDGGRIVADLPASDVRGSTNEAMRAYVEATHTRALDEAPA